MINKEWTPEQKKELAVIIHEHYEKSGERLREDMKIQMEERMKTYTKFYEYEVVK